jgi:carbon storage regulator
VAGEWVGLLVLTRKPRQSIMIGDRIEVTVLSAAGDKVRLGIQAPADVPVYRSEIYVEIRQQQREKAGRRDADADAVDLERPPEQR